MRNIETIYDWIEWRNELIKKIEKAKTQCWAISGVYQDEYKALQREIREYNKYMKSLKR